MVQLNPVVVNSVEQCNLNRITSKDLLGKFGIFKLPYKHFQFTIGLLCGSTVTHYTVFVYESASLEQPFLPSENIYLSIHSNLLILHGNQNQQLHPNLTMKTTTIQNLFQKIMF